MRAAAREEILAPLIDRAVLRHDRFDPALAALLADQLAGPALSAERLAGLVRSALVDDSRIDAAVAADLAAIHTRDPAAESYLMDQTLPDYKI